MLVYVNMGRRDFETHPIPLKDTVRYAWEFLACLDGRLIADIIEPRDDKAVWEQTFWAFPAKHRHSWQSHGEIERVVFHFTVVAPELTELLPRRGYYRAPLTESDCTRLRELALSARKLLEKETVKSAFLERMLAQELAQLALRDVPDRPLSADASAQARTERAVAWFAGHMAEGPGLREVCRGAHISTTHLRRLFHKTRGEGPHAVFNRLRMQRVEDLLLNSDLTMEAISERVGLSSASALNRAVKDHFGRPPQQLRTLRAEQRART
jgi:AraC family transcriptional regulator